MQSENITTELQIKLNSLKKQTQIKASVDNNLNLEVLNLVQAQLYRNGTQTKLIEVKDNLTAPAITALEIIPDTTSVFGQLANSTPASVHFNPAQLYIDGSTAFYNTYNNSLTVSIDAILNGRITDAEHHELAHSFYFNNLLKKGNSHFLNSYIFIKPETDNFNKYLENEMNNIEKWVQQINLPSGEPRPTTEGGYPSSQMTVIKLNLINYYKQLAIEEVFAFSYQAYKNFEMFITHKNNNDLDQADHYFSKSLTNLLIAGSLNRLAISQFEKNIDQLQTQPKKVQISSIQESPKNLHNPQSFKDNFMKQQLNYEVVMIESLGLKLQRFTGFSQQKERIRPLKPIKKPIPKQSIEQAIAQAQFIKTNLEHIDTSIHTILKFSTIKHSESFYDQLADLYQKYINSIIESI